MTIPIDQIVSNKSNPYGIPKELRRYIKNKYGWDKYKEFQKWYSINIRGNQKDEANVYKEFNRSLGEKDKQGRYSPNFSHVYSHKLGGSGYTFVEYWVYNQARAASEREGIPFIDPEKLREAGLPTNWIEFFYAWDQQTKGNFPLLGSLEQINPDDLIALHRGDPVNKVVKRRQALDHLYELAVTDPTTITQNQTIYAELFAKSRGLNPHDSREISLSRHAGWDLDSEGNWIQKSQMEAEADYQARQIERFADKGEINYGPLDEIQPEEEIVGAQGEEHDPSQIDSPPRHQWFTNPFSLQPKPESFKSIPKNESKLPKPEYSNKWTEANKPIRQLRDLSIRGLKIIATRGAINKAGVNTDALIGEGIRQADRLLNQSYAERVNPDSYINQRQLNILDELFPDD